MEKIIEGKTIILKFNYDLTASKVKEISELTNNHLQDLNDYDFVILDMKKVEYIDSVGITFIVATYKTVNKQNKVFKIMNTSEEIKDLFNLMRLDEKFDIS